MNGSSPLLKKNNNKNNNSTSSHNPERVDPVLRTRSGLKVAPFVSSSGIRSTWPLLAASLSLSSSDPPGVWADSFAIETIKRNETQTINEGWMSHGCQDIVSRTQAQSPHKPQTCKELSVLISQATQNQHQNIIITIRLTNFIPSALHRLAL